MSRETPSDPPPLQPSPETFSISADPAHHRSEAKLPESIGSYSVKRVIASGGMGIVYEARQENPRRAVAVKVMSHGVTSKSAMRRFEFEAQVLGRLRHPGIAQIYEAGTHNDHGLTVPYFAMEYIPGAQSITQYVKDKKLGTRERMKLFAQVCDAVHHGHQKGVIHRDLKPSNILVDTSGQVKIIDFGVARGTDSDLALTTLQTDMGQLIGTLQYMSPEQVQGDPQDIDIRSDVYSLGVVYFELLSDRLPYDVREIALSEATRVIREDPPTRLSLIDRTLRGDVETIALKALEKDRTRRYQSASDFGQDIQRYLTNEPISARPPSMVYRLRKFVRRRRVPLATAAILLFALGVGIYQQVQLRWNTSLLQSIEIINRVTLAALPDADFSNPAPIIADCTKAISIEPTLAMGYAIRAKAYSRRDDFASTKRDADKALELDPGNTVAWRALGHVYLLEGEFEKSRDAFAKGFRQFSDKNPDFPRDLHNQARAYAFMGDFRMALACHDGAVALAPNTSLTYVSRALTRRAAGHIEEALADIRHAVELKRAIWGVRGGLWTWEILKLRNGQGDVEAAAQALVEAEAIADTFEKAVISALRGQLEAEQLLSQAKTDDDRCCVFYYLGVKAMFDGRLDDAQTLWSKSVNSGMHKLPEYDLSRWHLAKTKAG